MKHVIITSRITWCSGGLSSGCAMPSAAFAGLTFICSSELLTITPSARGEFPPTLLAYTNLLHISPNDNIQLHVLHSQQQVCRLIAIRKNITMTCSSYSMAMVTTDDYLTTLGFPDTETTTSTLPARPCTSPCGMYWLLRHQRHFVQLPPPQCGALVQWHRGSALFCKPAWMCTT